MSQSTASADPVRVECEANADFQAWIAQAGGSLAVSTYQAGKVAMVGWDGRQLTLLMREFEKPLGLAVSAPGRSALVSDPAVHEDGRPAVTASAGSETRAEHEGQRLALATRHDVTVFANAPLLAHDYLETARGRYDALYLPRCTYHTGDLNTHDLAFQGDDLILVNTRFSCLARMSQDHNFEPFWKPRFVSDIVPEDRCHLNGLAMRDGQARYVTALGRTDEPGAWRPGKADGGVLIDVPSGEIILGGLSMPHSPRWHGNQLWVLNSGTGELLLVDPAAARSEAVCFLPGYLRGLCFVGPYALVGMCKIREKHIFGGLPIQKRLDRLCCGVAVVDLRQGAQVGMFEFTVGCEELYDLQFLPGVRRPTILNLDKPAVREAFTSPESSYWLRPSAER